MRITRKKKKGFLTFFSRFVPVMSLARVNFQIAFSAMGSQRVRQD